MCYTNKMQQSSKMLLKHVSSGLLCIKKLMWALTVHLVVGYKTNYFLQFSNLFCKPISDIKMQLWYLKFWPLFFPSCKFEWENAVRKLFADDTWGLAPGLVPCPKNSCSMDGGNSSQLLRQHQPGSPCPSDSASLCDRSHRPPCSRFLNPHLPGTYWTLK